MPFSSRQEAGQLLGQHIGERETGIDLVLGLARGGVVVAAEVARVLQSPFDVMIVRKIGHPQFREFAVGALGEADVVVLDEPVLRRSHIDKADLDAVIAEENGRLLAYHNRFARPDRPVREGKSIAIVDDGLATGATLEAAVHSARKQRARRILVAVPVASNTGARRIGRICDTFYALIIDPTFQAVGAYYESFAQTTDEEVLAILKAKTGG